MHTFISAGNTNSNSKAMPRGHVIVVGAGIAGLAMSRALSISGYKVTVIERNHAAVGASIRNFGMVWPVGQPSGELYETACRSRAIWGQCSSDAGIFYDPVGSLHLAYHQDEANVLEEVIVTARKVEESVQDIPMSVQVLAGATSDERGKIGHHVRESLDVGARSLRPPVAAVVECINRVVVCHELARERGVTATVFAQAVGHDDHRTRNAFRQPGLGVQLTAADTGSGRLTVLHGECR